MRLALRSALFATAVLVAPFFILLFLPTIAVGQSRLPPCSNATPVESWDNCQGTSTFVNGQYVGEFKDGKRNGQGTSTFGGGEQYVGEFKDGAYNGQGRSEEHTSELQSR